MTIPKSYYIMVDHLWFLRLAKIKTATGKN